MLLDALSSRNLHPEIIASLFKVHKRTVFRWVERGHLSLNNGHISSSQLIEPFRLWKISCSRPDAKSRLKVKTAYTITLWVKRGILKTVTVFGQKRVTLSSIKQVLSMPGYKPGAKKVLLNNTTGDPLAVPKSMFFSIKDASDRARVGTSAVMTVEDTSKFLGVSADEVHRLANDRKIRNTIVGDNLLLYVGSVEGYRRVLFR
jgi:hypothetical protein